MIWFILQEPYYLCYDKSDCQHPFHKSEENYKDGFDHHRLVNSRYERASEKVIKWRVVWLYLHMCVNAAKTNLGWGAVNVQYRGTEKRHHLTWHIFI